MADFNNITDFNNMEFNNIALNNIDINNVKLHMFNQLSAMNIKVKSLDPEGKLSINSLLNDDCTVTISL